MIHPVRENAMSKEYKDLIVGLDIGTSKVVAMVAEIMPDCHFEVIGMGHHLSQGLMSATGSFPSE